MGRSAAHVHHLLIEGRPEGEVVLDLPASHHLLRVRRLARDAELVVVDGAGHEARARLVGARDGRATIDVVGPWVARPVPRPIHLVWAIPKGPALDTGLRMAVEAGVTHIHLALGARSVARSDRAERWRRILAGACEQAGRPVRPHLDPLWPDLSAALDQVPEGTVAYAAAPGAPRATATGDVRAIAIGPEGGFSEAELDGMLDRGWHPLGLGPHVLRSDTAAAVGVALLTRD